MEKPIPYQPPLPPNEAPSGVDAAAGVTPVGLRPPFVTPAAAHSHPDCRGIPILIVALEHGLSIGAIIAAAACGAILGDNVGFRVGRRFGRTLLLKYGHRIGISERELILGEYLFQRYGGSIVFFGRFIAFLRVYAALLAGSNRLHPLP